MGIDIYLLRPNVSVPSSWGDLTGAGEWSSNPTEVEYIHFEVKAGKEAINHKWQRQLILKGKVIDVFLKEFDVPRSFQNLILGDLSESEVWKTVKAIRYLVPAWPKISGKYSQLVLWDNIANVQVHHDQIYFDSTWYDYKGVIKSIAINHVFPNYIEIASIILEWGGLV
jgi:hypothetical protein